MLINAERTMQLIELTQFNHLHEMGLIANLRIFLIQKTHQLHHIYKKDFEIIQQEGLVNCFINQLLSTVSQ